MSKKYISTMLSKIRGFYTTDDINREVFFLTFFRISVPFIALVDVLSLGGDFKLLFSENETFIPRELMYFFSEYKGIFDIIIHYLQTNGLISFFYNNLRDIYVVMLILMIIGFFTRLVTFLALIIQLIIFKSFNELNYGYDQFLTMSLFYCIWFPVGRYFSLDKYIFKFKERFVSFNYIRIIQLHLCVVYFFAGIAKALDPDWWNGMSLWRAVSSVYNDYFTISPYVLLIVGIGTVLLETLYTIFIWMDKTRYITLSLCVLMHLSIAYMLGLYSFSAILIVWNVAAFYRLKPDEIKN
jgi:hypothetical protein